ncbi:preprotein translocase subunit YajC [Roseospira marina]|uniref:Sec translocon accessory complex subunit YajC n=1 Tax=Roseospira marina TaxID=140057 RepID=A0A5M6IHU6_9PROT|nr:preprotein translocase subunit YajC [Roseospira marina]KAA5607527.1 preprotein translocase subunit YajC [Roseospira marina]MBB4312288.1 preprotein translocase subunit YajC [Roseospira marina]MBB5085696.1 preprotein translocase subunit YajC [Roseospira marina]
MLISPAFAQTAPGGDAMGSLGAFLPLILIFVIFYFLLIRPQQKRMKEHKAMLEAIRRGDRIVTNGGIIGTVVKVQNDTEVSVEIADGVRVRVMRDMIANVLSKTEPVSGGGDGKGKPANEETAAAPAATGNDNGGAAGKLKSLLSGKKS